MDIKIEFGQHSFDHSTNSLQFAFRPLSLIGKVAEELAKTLGDRVTGTVLHFSGLEATSIVGAGLAFLIGCIALYRRRQALAALLALALALFGLIGDWHLPIGKEQAVNLVVIDLSASNLARYDAKDWANLEGHLNTLHTQEERPSLLALINRDVVRSERFEAGQAITLGAKPFPIGHESEGFRPSLSLDLLGQAPNRIWLISDQATSLNELAASFDASRIALLPGPSGLRDSTRIISFSAPHFVAEGESALVSFAISGVQGGEATIRWELSKGSGKGSFTTPIGPLSAQHQIVIPAKELAKAGSGEVSLTLKVQTQSQDFLPENNQVTHTFQVGGRPSILMISPYATRTQSACAQLLRQGGYQVSAIAPKDMPKRAEGYLGYSSVIMDDVAISEMPDKGQALGNALANYGVNLIVAGARHAWGPGGYQGTRFEQKLPIDSNPKANHQRWHILLLDASDSMNEGLKGQTKFAWLRDAVAAYLSGLDSEDQVLLLPFNRGVIGASHFFRAATIEEREAMLNALSTVAPSSQTHIRASIHKALQILSTLRTKEEEEARVTVISDAQESGPAAEGIPEDLENLGVNLEILLVNERKPSWIDELASSRISTTPIASFTDLAETLRRRIHEENKSLFHSEAIVAKRFRSSNQSAMQIAPWVETRSKSGVSAIELSRYADAGRFPLAVRWKYLAGEVIGVTTSLTAPDASLANDPEWQKHFAELVSSLEGNPEKTLIEAEYRERRIIVRLLHQDIASRTPGLSATLVGADGHASEEFELLRQNAAGEFQSAQEVASEGARIALRIVEDGETRTLNLPLRRGVDREYLPDFRAYHNATSKAEHLGVQVLPHGSSHLRALDSSLDPSLGLSSHWLLIPLALASAAWFLIARRREEIA